ncbi:ATP-binding protein [Williamsia sp. 1135]|uniref:ATP-binding protein n=1 Tax=Williamsia sp. 1135 TaxID=1889262 RepID=UPI000A1155E6|nr:ATP-binding protein [Williamsia sp. 1135]ORM38273.1 hypothetical protein BFL43_00380 [Williamsia sp. 1135]
MRTDLSRLLLTTAPIVLLTGDSGTGKTSILQACQTELRRDHLAAPAPVTCKFDSGALQLAILNALSVALAEGSADKATWRRLRHRLGEATRKTAVDIGKNLGKAVTQELMSLVKSRIGEHAGEGIGAFIKNLRTDSEEALRRDLRARSDENVVRLLIALADSTAAVLGSGLVLALDECQRLTDEDHRILASMVLDPPKRARLIIAWSTADDESRRGLTRLREQACTEITVSGMTDTEVQQWVRDAHLDEAAASRIFALSNGYPLVVEGLIRQLRSGQSLDGYTAPTAFTSALADALIRLQPSAHAAARRLSAFVDPPSETRLLDYLGYTSVEWGVVRAALVLQP